MDVRINEVQSRIQTVDSQNLLDPQVLAQIVRACLRAIEERQSREKHLAAERRLTSHGGESE